MLARSRASALLCLAQDRQEFSAGRKKLDERKSLNAAGGHGDEEGFLCEALAVPERGATIEQTKTAPPVTTRCHPNGRRLSPFAPSGSTLRETLIERGFKNTNRFSCEKTARKMLETLEATVI